MDKLDFNTYRLNLTWCTWNCPLAWETIMFSRFYVVFYENLTLSPLLKLHNIIKHDVLEKVVKYTYYLFTLILCLISLDRYLRKSTRTLVRIIVTSLFTFIVSICRDKWLLMINIAQHNNLPWIHRGIGYILNFCSRPTFCGRKLTFTVLTFHTLFCINVTAGSV